MLHLNENLKANGGKQQTKKRRVVQLMSSPQSVVISLASLLSLIAQISQIRCKLVSQNIYQNINFSISFSKGEKSEALPESFP